MYLIQLFLPLYVEKGSVFDEEHFAAVRHHLTENFGGVCEGGAASNSSSILLSLSFNTLPLRDRWPSLSSEALDNRLDQLSVG